ncbi:MULTISPECIES: YxeA family protein [unclassified Oceanobacillus]|uniref:YxeA family protein n=1 Tax=unclassified Oceanobacillus TaxID=2630292 RepID=UPI00300E48F5
MKFKLWKVILLIVGLVMIIGIGSLVLFYDYDKLSHDHPKGKDMYYTVITSEGTKDSDDRYTYEVMAYDENAKEKELEFSASNQLREGAYIQLYYTRFRGVTYWEEVDLEELSATVQEQFE